MFCVMFSNKVLANSLPVIFNNIEVQRVFQHKHLGIWLSSTLSLQKQIHEICIRANAKLAHPSPRGWLRVKKQDRKTYS